MQKQHPPIPLVAQTNKGYSDLFAQQLLDPKLPSIPSWYSLVFVQQNVIKWQTKKQDKGWIRFLSPIGILGKRMRFLPRQGRDK